MQRTADTLDATTMSSFSRSDFDQLAFGVIELDREFIVRTFNQSESTLARRSAEDTIGKHFFRDVAPCTDHAEFRGRIADLLADGVPPDSEERFDYTFTFAWGSRRVRIRALRGAETCWVFVTSLRSFEDDR